MLCYVDDEEEEEEGSFFVLLGFFLFLCSCINNKSPVLLSVNYKKERKIDSFV